MTSTTNVVRRRPDDVTRRILCVALITCSCLVTDCSLGAVNQRRHPSGDDVMDDVGCSSVKAAYESKGFNVQDVPQQTITGGLHLIICKQQTTCCTRDMEYNLSLKTSHDISQLIMQKLNEYRQNFVTHLIKFDEYFVALIDRSHADLHDMFLRTYGRMYEQNVQIFVDLFREIRSFYKKTSAVDVHDVLDRFFAQLMRRVFCLLNSDRQFDDEFFACIDEHLDQLRPFGDIPLKLRLQMKRSFTAARAFVDGLGTGRDVILAMSKLDYSVDCLNELMKLTYCSYCQGLTDIKPCTDYCLDVFRGCVGYYSNINRLWNAYLGEMITLASRLDGPFNVEMVVSPLGIKLSEAVMVFQENFNSFSSKVFLGCDDSKKLQHRSSDSRNETRRRREVESTKSSLDFEFASTPSPNPYPGYPMQENSNHSILGSVRVNVSQLVHDVLGRLVVMRDIWKNFPELFCNETSLADLDEAASCWNGSNALRKSGDDDDGNDNLYVDEKAASSHMKHSNVIQKELFELHLAISRIKNAHSGINEDTADSDDDLSGSGDQSGSGTDDLDDQLQTTEVVYIDLVSSSQMVTEEARVATASTSHPQTISTASDARIHFLTCLSWMVSAWTVIFSAEMNLLQF